MQARRDEPRLVADTVLIGGLQRLDQVEGGGGRRLEGGDDGLSLEILDNLRHVGLPLLSALCHERGPKA
jgi:hypothetical protein